jgi:Zn ribbon nucleic-acid-binding protein
MSRVCQATAAICKRLQFWLAETVCSDLQFRLRVRCGYKQQNAFRLRVICGYKQQNADRGFEVIA